MREEVFFFFLWVVDVSKRKVVEFFQEIVSMNKKKKENENNLNIQSERVVTEKSGRVLGLML